MTLKSTDVTISAESPIGQHLEKVNDCNLTTSYLVFNKQKLKLVDKMTIGRSSDCTIVIDNRLVSRVHASVQKIKDDFFLKDEGSTNGTFLNNEKIPNDKFLKLKMGDTITVGNESLVIS